MNPLSSDQMDLPAAKGLELTSQRREEEIRTFSVKGSGWKKKCSVHAAVCRYAEPMAEGEGGGAEDAKRKPMRAFSLFRALRCWPRNEPSFPDEKSSGAGGVEEHQMRIRI